MRLFSPHGESASETGLTGDGYVGLSLGGRAIRAVVITRYAPLGYKHRGHFSSIGQSLESRWRTLESPELYAKWLMAVGSIAVLAQIRGVSGIGLHGG